MTNLIRKEVSPIIAKKAIPDFKSIVEEREDSVTNNPSKIEGSPEAIRLETKITEKAKNGLNIAVDKVVPNKNDVYSVTNP
jgi:hypothetical protein